jgi:hypothetical protein
MRILICGGRDWTDYETLSATLDELHSQRNVTSVIHGNALGADYLGGVWARHNKIPVLVFPADWNKHGTKAGPIRNQRMLDEGCPSLCVAFPGGRGTNDMIRRSKDKGIEVYVAGDYYIEK